MNLILGLILIVIIVLISIISGKEKEIERLKRNNNMLSMSNDVMSQIIRKANIKEVPPKDLKE